MARTYGCFVYGIDLSVNMILTALERAAAAGNGDKARMRGRGAWREATHWTGLHQAAALPTAAARAAAGACSAANPLLHPQLPCARCPQHASRAGLLRNQRRRQARLPAGVIRRRHQPRHAAAHRRQARRLQAVRCVVVCAVPICTVLLLPAAACCCLLPAAACCCLLLLLPLPAACCCCRCRCRCRCPRCLRCARCPRCLSAFHPPPPFPLIHPPRRLYEVLRPGGRLLITDYCRGAEGEPSEGFAAYIAQRGYDLHTLEVGGGCRGAGHRGGWTHSTSLHNFHVHGARKGDVCGCSGERAIVGAAERGPAPPWRPLGPARPPAHHPLTRRPPTNPSTPPRVLPAGVRRDAAGGRL